MSWEESMSTMGERIRHSFMRDDELADVSFIVGPGKVRVPAHKTLLSLSSPVFRAQFNGPLSRVNEEGHGPTIVEIPDMKAATFIAFVSFLYRDELTDGNKGTAEEYLDLLYPANKYLVPALSRLCVEELRDKIEPENVFQVYETALLYGEVKLQSWCLRYMNRVSKKIIELPQFLNLDPSMLSAFLESDGLTASEQEIHQAVLRWAKAKLRRDGEKKSPASIRNALGELIFLIRFPTMSVMEFCQEEQDSGLCREEILEIYRQISCKDTATVSRFGAQKRRMKCKMYTASCCPDSSEFVDAQQPPYKLFRFKLRTNKRIFLDGVFLPSFFAVEGLSDYSDFEVGLSVQVGDLPCVSKLAHISGFVAEIENIKERRRLHRAGTYSKKWVKICSVRLDEPSEVPANCSVAICVEVRKASIQGRIMQAYLEPFDDLEFPVREQVEVNCPEDDQKFIIHGDKLNWLVTVE